MPKPATYRLRGKSDLTGAKRAARKLKHGPMPTGTAYYGWMLWQLARFRKMADKSPPTQATAASLYEALNDAAGVAIDIAEPSE